MIGGQGCNSFSHCTNYLVGGILNPALWLGITIGNMHVDWLFFELDSRRFALITSYVTLFGLFCEVTHCILIERLYFPSTFTLIPDNAVDFDLILVGMYCWYVLYRNNFNFRWSAGTTKWLQIISITC